MVSKVFLVWLENVLGLSTNIFQYSALLWKIRVEKLTFLFKISDVYIIIINWRKTTKLFLIKI